MLKLLKRLKTLLKDELDPLFRKMEQRENDLDCHLEIGVLFPIEKLKEFFEVNLQLLLLEDEVLDTLPYFLAESRPLFDSLHLGLQLPLSLHEFETENAD